MMAKAVGNEKHHEHGAHSHGSGTLTLAFDGVLGKIEFKTAAFGIIGFEHIAKNENDRKKIETTISSFEKSISKLVQFSAALSCSFKKEKIEMVHDPDGDNHADFIANFSVACSKSPLESTLKIDFSQYPKIKDLDITILIDDLQKSAEFKGKPVTVDLK
jgi:hypothetical protein